MSKKRNHYAYLIYGDKDHKEWVSIRPKRDALVFSVLVLIITMCCNAVITHVAKETLVSSIQYRLETIAKMTAEDIDGDAHRRITTPDHMGGPDYMKVMGALSRALAANDDLVFAYTNIFVNGKAYFVVDSQYQTSQNEEAGNRQSPATVMEEYPEANNELYKALVWQVPKVTGTPYKDEWGTFLSAYAPFYDSYNSFVGTVGVDINASRFYALLDQIWKAFYFGAALAFVLSIIVYYLVLRTQTAHANDYLTNQGVQEKYAVELETAKVAVEKAAQVKSQFLANMSHEIRTPLNGIIATIDILSRTGLDDAQKKYVSVIQKSGRLLLEIINEILDFSKIDAGKLHLSNVPFSLRQSIEDRIGLLRPLAAEKSLYLNLTIEESLPDHLVGDVGRILQIVANLVGNAIKFTEAGGITVQVSRGDEEKAGGSFVPVRIIVSDTGVGIPAEKVSNLFQAFSQVDDSSVRKTSGTGLGLVISKRLVEAMDGEIDVESDSGRGATFWVTIPLQEDPKQSRREIEADDGAAGAGRLAGKRILVAEDGGTNQFVISSVLRGLHCDFDIVNNGEDALRAVEENEYDAVLMDCQMPVMDGYTATRKIRESGNTDLVIVALTANAMSEDRQKGMDSGMNDYISKPFVQDDIVKTLSKWI